MKLAGNNFRTRKAMGFFHQRIAIQWNYLSQEAKCLYGLQGKLDRFVEEKSSEDY